MRVAQILLGGGTGVMFLVRHLLSHGSVALSPFTSSEFYCGFKSRGGGRDGGAAQQVSRKCCGEWHKNVNTVVCSGLREGSAHLLGLPYFL